jgi:hypothetical protein
MQIGRPAHTPAYNRALPSLADGLAYWWTFFEGGASGTSAVASSVLNDISGKNRNATLATFGSGGTFETTSSYRSGYGWRCNGSRWGWTTGTGAVYGATNRLSISFWFLVDSLGTGSYPTWIGQTTSASWNDGYGCWNVDKPRFWTNSAYNPGLSLPDSTVLGTWNHIVYTYKPNNYNIYLNGVLKSSGSTWTGNVPAVGKLQFSGAVGDYAEIQYTRMSDLRIYTKALSQTEVSAVYAGLG